jgi:transposase
MEAMVERVCGLDVHKKWVVACLLVGPAGQRPRKEIRRFETFTQSLVELRRWLESEHCQVVVMESTGIYWKPVYAVLEGVCTLIVGNAYHIKNVPGRKTDVKDAEWLAELARHGLVAPSFVPPPAIRELRELTRYRRKVVEARSAERNRLLRLLETANIKLSNVASDVFGVSGMLMLHALVENRATPSEMAELAKRGLRKKLALLTLALEGRLNDGHRYVLKMQLHRLEQVNSDIAALDQRIAEKLEPYQVQVQLLRGIPGIDQALAAVIIAELGIDMTVFRSVHHCAAWAGLAPGNHESGGKHRRETARRGNVHLKTALVEAANAAARTKNTYLRAKFFRLKARRGHMRAAVAIAHKLLIAAFHMLRKNVAFLELGDDYLDKRAATSRARTLVRVLERMGYSITLEKKAVA